MNIKRRTASSSSSAESLISQLESEDETETDSDAFIGDSTGANTTDAETQAETETETDYASENDQKEAEPLPCTSKSCQKFNRNGSKKLKMTDKPIRWNTLEHKGPLPAPEYTPLPENVHFKYDNKPLRLSENTEMYACHYARLPDDRKNNKVFNNNFFNDWRNEMTSNEKNIIKDFKKCDLTEILEYLKQQSELKKGKSKEEKQADKQRRQEIDENYGYCLVDGRKEKIGNFRLEPPGIFRGRGDHPKMGKLKKRVEPEDVTINCSEGKDPVPPEGHRWEEVIHDQTVTWLASWIDPVTGNSKYVWLAGASTIKAEKDRLKYETAKQLGAHIEGIRDSYMQFMSSNDLKRRQLGVALYFIDQLALRAGHEKDEDNSADTVGCCSLRCEHVTLLNPEETTEDTEYFVKFDFPGKDSIPYQRKVKLPQLVYDQLKDFKKDKNENDSLFDKISTTMLNDRLKQVMPNLSAKVFRTFNASLTLEQQLGQLTPKNGTQVENVDAYNRANRQVAILCNHQRSVPKSHEKSMENIDKKIQEKKEQLQELESQGKKLSNAAKIENGKKIDNLKKKLKDLELKKKSKEEGKAIALGTSKLNYLDPRITIAWCLNHGVKVEKVYSKAQREKFKWAIDADAADRDFKFCLN